MNEFDRYKTDTAKRKRTTAISYVPCAQLTNVNTEKCAVQEAKILASVVRLVLHGYFQQGSSSDFRGSTGHGTVMAGRYLVTHNHFSIDLATLAPKNHLGITGFSLYNAAGERIMANTPVGSFQVWARDSQTLVLDFGPHFFDSLNIHSASFVTASDAKLFAGTEIAQLDWDAERTYVVWTAVVKIANHPLPHLEIDNYIMPGASGGGVFWHGHHIANNWADMTVTDAHTGELTRAYSLAALNNQNLLTTSINLIDLRR
jgi:hypothetical protein